MFLRLWVRAPRTRMKSLTGGALAAAGERKQRG
jgi:hypothetical protein